jgi:hypothetical protein
MLQIRAVRIPSRLHPDCLHGYREARLELNLRDWSFYDLKYPAFFPTPPDELTSEREVIWFYFLAEIALRRLANRILTFIYSMNTSEATATSQASLVEQVRAFEQQATDWQNSLPPRLSLERISFPSPGEPALYQTLRFILEGEAIDCYEMMYQPFIVRAMHEGTGLDPTSSDFVQKALTLALQRINKNQPGFFFRHHGTWAMTRSCTRSALLLLAASRTVNLRHLLPQGWRVAVGKVAEMLHFWRRELDDAADRLRLIETMLAADERVRDVEWTQRESPLQQVT